MKRFLVTFIMVLSSAHAGEGPPTVDYFETPGIPLDSLNAPAISNHWLWAQADALHGKGIFNLANVRAGAATPKQGTLVVRANGEEIVSGPTVDWRPNQIVRRSSAFSLEFTGRVRAADRKYAFLNRLEIHNPGSESVTIDLQLEFAMHALHQAVVERGGKIDPATPHLVDFPGLTIAPGENRVLRIATLLRGNERGLSALVTGFDDEWAASDRYWNAVLADAFDPEPGLFLSGGMPNTIYEDPAITRLYRFGIVTALMCLKNDPDRRTSVNWYGTSMPDTVYGVESYIWDVGYASDVLAQMDPAALRNVIEHWAMEGVHHRMAIPYHREASILGPRFYAANGTLFTWSVLNYLEHTGDYGWLDTDVRSLSVWEQMMGVDAWHEGRPKWNGLAHYGEEANLFDDRTVPGYHHWVAAPNAGAAWIKRRLADLAETHRGDPDTAARLRAEADALVKTLIENLYQSEGDHAGTWRQRHADGSFAELRYGWDFMYAGTFLNEDLTAEQRQQVRDWFQNNCARIDPEAIWMVMQDPRDGNNGTHQMEHNGRGAYPAWPFHAAWSLRELGFPEDARALTQQVAPITKWGAISQGNDGITGLRCRSGWASVAGASLATMVQEAFPETTGRIVSVEKIWDEATHNAFTDLVRFGDEWFCVFREAQGHVSPAGKLRVIASPDGKTWRSAALIEQVGNDLRDAKISVTPEGELMLIGAAAIQENNKTVGHQTYTWFSKDGETWSEENAVGDKDVWLWRATWNPHDETAYGTGYGTASNAGKTRNRLYRSEDGLTFEVLVPELLPNDTRPNESSILYREDGTAHCLLRRDGVEKNALLGISRPPYQEWVWKDLGVRIGGPHMIELPDGRTVAAVRLYDSPVRTSLCWVDPEKGTLEEFLALPSGGDTSYAGLVWHDDHLWVSYYSGHEANNSHATTAIYLARVAFDVSPQQ